MGNRVTPASFFKHTPKAKRYQEGHELTESNKRCLEKDRKFLEATERKREERRAKIKSGEIKLKKGGPISREAIAGINYDPTKDLPVQPADTIPPDMQEARDKYDKWKAEYDQLTAQMKASRPSKEERIQRAIESNEYERLKHAAKFMKRDERLMMESFIAANETMNKILEQNPQPAPTPSPSPQPIASSSGSQGSQETPTRAEANVIFAQVLAKTMHNQQLFDAAFRELCLSSLFFLLVYGLNRKDADRDWIYHRCNEVQANPNGHLDLVFRAGYKSTVITFALTIQDILRNPNLTIGIFSHTRPIAKTFLRQIKREFETNDTLKRVFSDILYDNPNSQAAKWNEDDGIVVKRNSNPKEGTLESWGLVDGQPTSRHFDVMIYDDVVTLESVSTPEMIQKTTNAWEISLNLRSEHGVSRYIGTRYHRSDTYQIMLDRGAAIPRIYPIYDTDSEGNQTSPPILLTQEQVDQKRKEMGPFTFSSQMLLNPVALDVQGFKESWLRYWKPNPANLNIYITCDPAGEKKKSSDYTVFMVIGLGPDQNYYLIDMIRDRLSLTERGDTLFHLHKLYRPKAVGYEKYGKDSDIEHYEDRMKQENYRFPIIPLKGAVSKNDRIRKLIPLFEQSRVFIPEYLIKTDYEGKQQNLTQAFVRDEYLAFPIGQHDDMIDCLARILDKDLNARFPYASADGSSIMSRGNFRVIRGRRAC